MKDLNKAIHDQVNNLRDLDTEKKKAEKTNEDLKKTQKELTIANIQETQARKDLRATMEAEAVLQNKEAGTLAKVTAENKKLTLEKKKLNLETEEGKKRLLEINTQLDKNTEVMRANGSAAEKQRMNIGNYASALDGLPGPLGAASAAGTKFSRVLTVIEKHPIIFAISLIVAAFAGLVKIFKTTEEGGDKIAKIMTQVKGVLNVVKQAAQSVTLALADLFSGKFRQASEHLKEGFSGLGGRMAAAAESGGLLYDALDKIGSEKLAYNVDIVREKIAQLRSEAAETTNDNERARLLNEAIALTEEMYSKEIDWSRRTTDATLSDLAIKYGKSADELKKFTLLSYEEREKVAANDRKLADFANKLNDDGLAKLFSQINEESRLRKEAYMETLRLKRTATSATETADKEAVAAFKQYTEQQKKLAENLYKVQSDYAQRFADEKKEIDDELAKMLDEDLSKMSMIENDWLKVNLDQIETARLKELTSLEQLHNQGLVEEEDYQKAKLDIDRKYGVQLVNEQIAQLQASLENTQLTADQKSEIYKKLAEYQLKLQETVAEAEKSSGEKWLDENEKRADEIIGSAQGIADNLFAIGNNRIESEISAIERKRDKEIEAAGDSKEKQEAINKKYDRLVAEQEYKKAKNERDAALFQIAIDTIVATTKYALVGNWIMAGLSAIIGATQAGVVLAKKLPEFRIGTKDSPEGWAKVGEEGRELMIDTYGGVQLSPERASLVYLKPHTQIIPARETDLIMQKAIENREPDRTVVNVDMEPVIEAIKNKREYTFNFTDEGIKISERQGNWNRNYMNNFRI